MKKRTIFSFFFAFVIVLTGLPVIALMNQSEVSAQATECVSYSDDFSTNSGDWRVSFGSGSITNGTANVTADATNGAETTTFGAAFVFDKTTTGEFDFALSGDWTLDYELKGLSTNSAYPEEAELYAGSELYMDDGVGGIENFYALYTMYTEADGNFIYSDTLNAQDQLEAFGEIYSSADPVNGQTIYFRYVKVGTTVTSYFSTDGTNYTLVHELSGFYSAPYFRFFNIAYLTDTATGNVATFDNFSVTCDGVIEEPPVDPIDTTTPFNVQRFFNIRIGSAHFYSIDPVEAKFVEDNSKAGGLWPGAFVKEDPTFAAFNYDSVNDKCMDGTSPVYRYLNRTTGDTHFYAIKADEISAVEGQFASTFKPEGVSFCAYLTEATGSVPVYRWQNKILGSTHFYSASPTEVNVVNNDLSSTFSPEGIAFYGMPVDNVDYSVQIVDPTTEPTPAPVDGTVDMTTDYPNFTFNYDSAYWTYSVTQSKSYDDVAGQDVVNEKIRLTNSSGSQLYIDLLVNYDDYTGWGTISCSNDVFKIENDRNIPVYRFISSGQSSFQEYIPNVFSFTDIGSNSYDGEGDQCGYMEINPDYKTATNYDGSGNNLAGVDLRLYVSYNENNQSELEQKADEVVKAITATLN